MKINGVGFQGRDSGPLEISENIWIARVAKRLENISFSFVTDEKGSTYTGDLGGFLRDLYNSNRELKRQLAELRRQAAPYASRTATGAVAETRNALWDDGLDFMAGISQSSKLMTYKMGFCDGFRACKEAVVENLKTVKPI